MRPNTPEQRGVFNDNYITNIYPCHKEYLTKRSKFFEKTNNGEFEGKKKGTKKKKKTSSDEDHLPQRQYSEDPQTVDSSGQKKR